MAFVLDVLVILIMAFCIWNGWRKGFIKALSRLLTFVLALALALLLNGPVSQLVYDTTMAPGIRDTLAEHLQEEATGTVEEQVDAALDNLPGFVRNMLDNQGVDSGAAVVEQLDGTTDVAASLAERIETAVIAPNVVMMIRGFVFFVLFFVCSLVASLLTRLLNKLFDLPVLRTINNSLGFIPGAINGVLWVLALASVAQVLAATGTADSFINPSVLEDTMIMQWLVSINPLGNTLQELTTIANP